MSAVPQTEPIAREPARCLARSVVDAFKEDSTLEAVTIDGSRQTLSVAALGKTGVPQVTERIRETIQRAQTDWPDAACQLLAGEGDCRSCAQPLSEAELRRITIQRQGG